MKDTNRILIVSSDEAVRRGYLQPINNVFRNVEFVSDGDSAINAMEQQPFDVILLDVWTSGFDGLAVLRSIKQRWPACEVVIITGDPSVANAKDAVRLGAFDYVAKPLAPQQVIALTIDALTQKSWAIHRVLELAGAGERGRTSIAAAAHAAGHTRANGFRGRGLS